MHAYIMFNKYNFKNALLDNTKRKRITNAGGVYNNHRINVHRLWLLLPTVTLPYSQDGGRWLFFSVFWPTGGRKTTIFCHTALKSSPLSHYLFLHTTELGTRLLQVIEHARMHPTIPRVRISFSHGHLSEYGRSMHYLFYVSFSFIVFLRPVGTAWQTAPVPTLVESWTHTLLQLARERERERSTHVPRVKMCTARWPTQWRD